MLSIAGALQWGVGALLWEVGALQWGVGALLWEVGALLWKVGALLLLWEVGTLLWKVGASLLQWEVGTLLWKVGALLLLWKVGALLWEDTIPSSLGQLRSPDSEETWSVQTQISDINEKRETSQEIWLRVIQNQPLEMCLFEVLANPKNCPGAQDSADFSRATCRGSERHLCRPCNGRRQVY